MPVSASRRVAGSKASRTASPQDRASPPWCISSRITSVRRSSVRRRCSSGCGGDLGVGHRDPGVVAADGALGVAERAGPGGCRPGCAASAHWCLRCSVGRDHRDRLDDAGARAARWPPAARRSSCRRRGSPPRGSRARRPVAAGRRRAPPAARRAGRRRCPTGRGGGRRARGGRRRWYSSVRRGYRARQDDMPGSRVAGRTRYRCARACRPGPARRPVAPRRSRAPATQTAAMTASTSEVRAGRRVRRAPAASAAKMRAGGADRQHRAERVADLQRRRVGALLGGRGQLQHQDAQRRECPAPCPSPATVQPTAAVTAGTASLVAAAASPMPASTSRKPSASSTQRGVRSVGRPCSQAPSDQVSAAPVSEARPASSRAPAAARASAG